MDKEQLYCHITFHGVECKVIFMFNINDIAEQNLCSSLHNKCQFRCRCNEDESRPSNAESEQSDGSSVYKSSSSSANNSSTSSLTSDTVSTYLNLSSGKRGRRVDEEFILTFCLVLEPCSKMQTLYMYLTSYGCSDFT